MKSLIVILLSAVAVFSDLCLAQQPPLIATPSADLDERVDIPTELQSPIDMRLLIASQNVMLKVLSDVRVSSATTIPKGTKLTAKITLMRPCYFAGSSADSAMALLVNEANWKGQKIPLRGYLWGPITSITVLTKLIITNEQRNLAKIGTTSADPVLGSVITFRCFEISGVDCHEHPESLACAQQRFESGSTLTVRHLPSRYQLSLLYDDNAYAVARGAEVGAHGGSVDGAYELAQRFRNGDLFVRDDAQALRWFSMAAEKGHLDAQTNLAVFLAEGLGTSAPDFVAAYKWFAVSVGRGVEQNKIALQKLERIMKPEQVAEGKKLSEDWLQTHSMAKTAPTGAFRVGSGFSAPKEIYAPDPEYSDEARKAKLQGTCVLFVLIGSDGRPRDIKVLRTLGLGLDEKSIEAVKTWRFEPAMKDGKPVTALIRLEVHFHLYPDAVASYCTKHPTGFYGAPGTASGVSCSDWARKNQLKQ